MEFATNWRFDEFYPEALQMRRLIDEHFTESSARHLPFSKRGIWNYWFIPTLYTYFRAEPWLLFGPEMFDAFMAYLGAFAARQFGLIIPTKPFISMYVNGCGQNIHNDFGNGRLAYVFSLTNWAERRFLGGETFVYKTADRAAENVFRSTGGWGWYDFIDPLFNRLALFDDRLPHAVNFVQGTMDPLDARFALHGHMEEPDFIAHIEGGLQGADLRREYAQMKESVGNLFRFYGLDGFVSLELQVDGSGRFTDITLRAMQLLAKTKAAREPAQAVADAREIIARIGWPQAQGPSKLVFALASSPLR